MEKPTGIIVIGDHANRTRAIPKCDIVHMSYIETVLSVTTSKCTNGRDDCGDDPGILKIHFGSKNACESAFNKAVEDWRDYVDAAPDNTLGVQVDGLMARPVDEVNIGAQECATLQSDNDPLSRTSPPPSGIVEA